MLNVPSRRAIVVLLLCIFSAGCATSEDENAVDRRVYALEEDNASLRKQIEDLNAVETALSRELEAQKNANGGNTRKAAVLERENAALKENIARLQRELSSREVQPMTEKPASLVDIDEEAIRGRNVKVIQRGDGTVAIRIQGISMFNTAQDTLTAAGQKVLDRIGRFLRSHSDLLISVEGHTDATPLGKSKAVWGTNLALSLARAMAVQEYLRSKQKIPEKRMRVVGYGEHRPLVPGRTKAANAKNRRVEIVLYSEPG